MDYINYDDQNQPSQQQQPHSTTPISHHPHHQPAMNHSFPQHLQLQPVSQQHASFLQPHHSQPTVSTTTSPHLHHLQQGGQPVPFLPLGVNPLGFAPIRGGEGGTERGHSQQDVPPISHLPQIRGPGQIMDNIFSPVIQDIDPPTSHFQPPAQSSPDLQPHESSSPQQLPSSSTTTTTTTTTQPTRPPLIERQARMDSDGNLQRNASQEVGKKGNAMKPMLHANLPEGFSYRFADEDGRTIKGVQVNRVIQKSQWFGPFNGTLLDEDAGQDIGSTWELCLRGDVWFYVDGRNKLHNNWLYHINPARTREEQNLEALQHYGDIYFRALDTIQPGTELKVFYSDEYREKIGCKMKLEDLGYDEEAGCFRCHWCEKIYNISKSMLRHMKLSHSEEDQTPSKSSNLKEMISKKARMMEAVKQAQKETSNWGSSKTALGKEPPCDQQGHFVCVTCGKHFPTSGRLNAHERFHESTFEKFECDMCDAVFKTSLSLRRHKKVHEDQRFTCTMCFKKYSERSHLSRHMNTAHGFERLRGKIVCMGCMKKFLLEDDMLQHLQSCRGLQKLMKEKEQEPFEDKDNDEPDKDDNGSFPYQKFGLCPKKVLGKMAQSSQSHGKLDADSDSMCTMCHKKYSSRSHLSRHMHTAHGFERAKGKIVCRGCSKMFRLEDDMSLHFKRCKGLQELILKKKKMHKRLKDSEEEDDDFIPNQKEDQYGIASGGPEQASNQALSINDCNKKGTVGGDTSKQGEDENCRVIDMLGVRSNQDASKPFKCSYCTKRFFTKNRLLRHKRERHPKSSIFKCDRCDQTFPYKHRLMKHLSSHQKEKRYKCQLCPRSFASESALSNHQQEHTDARPHKCEPCMRAFRTRKLLLSHNRRIHSVRELRFACSFCDKKFPEKSSLVLHERRHRGIRPHVCLTCGKAFTSKHCLVSHNRLHTGEKPFKCNLCGKCFPLNHHLEHHLVSHTRQGAESATQQESQLN